MGGLGLHVTANITRIPSVKKMRRHAGSSPINYRFLTAKPQILLVDEGDIPDRILYSGLIYAC